MVHHVLLYHVFFIFALAVNLPLVIVTARGERLAERLAGCGCRSFLTVNLPHASPPPPLHLRWCA